MISRTILLALCCACTLALSPLAPPTLVGDNSDCALYLNGPGRTSAYDYSINLLKGNFGYEGQPNCITFEAIDQAYVEARNRILVSQPKGDWGAEDFGSVGELILDISINLARRYGLTYEEIEKGLPLIDTSRTLIREVCPPVFSHVECRAGKYRRLDGLCNNLKNPTWGATMAPFQRLIGPLFADGINAPRIAHHGRDLPLSRVVSRTMHPDDGFHDHAGTVMVIAWGQFMDHDYTLTGTPLDPVNRNDPEECCKRPLHLKHPYCNEIRIPDDDYFYRLFGVKCIDFVRGFPSPRPGCRLGSRIPFNTLTGSIDGNTVYGVTEKFARKLRTGFGGLLRMNPVFKEFGLKDLLPLKLDIPDEGCTRPNKNMYCFEAGEIRVNEQLVLTVMHTLMAREHNRVAIALAEVNPHWDDETLFQEARRINIAEIQHITYNEFLPILLGKDVMEKFGLVLAKDGYWDGYDPEVNPDVIASFAAAAYRFGHSLLPTAVERWSKAHKFIASKRLSDLIRRPYDLYRAGVLDEYVMGLMNQVAQAMDDSITQEVTNHLFKKVGARFGMDLVSFNMQRGREFGLPGYMEFRKFCGLPAAETFQDLFGSMPNETVRKYETIFDHPIDVDLWSGGVSERALPGSMLGPTFACIIATQFSYSRRGDRFWFELPNQPSSFTPDQLAEIRKSRLARIICDNTDIIDTTQLYPFVLPDHELNPRVPCRSGILPAMDFSKWAEPVPYHSSAKQFMTNATLIENNSTEPVSKENNDTDNSIVKTSAQSLLLLDTLKLNNATDSPTMSPSKNVKENSTKLNDIADDTLLKYVFKKDDKHVDVKSKGHNKNSLKRRRRSTDADSRSPLPARIAKPSVIVNYETSHGPGQENTGWLPIKAGNILDTNLADFKIETEHTNPRNNKYRPENRDKGSIEPENSSGNINESTEKDYDGDIEKGKYDSRETTKSQPSEYNDNHRDASAESNSRESLELNSSIKNKQPNHDSSEQNDSSEDNKSSGEHSKYNVSTKNSNSESSSDESAELNSDLRTKPSYTPRDDSRDQYDSGESKKSSKPPRRYNDNNSDSSIEVNSDESTESNTATNKHANPYNSNERYKSRGNKKYTPDNISNSDSSESNEASNKIYNERKHLEKIKDIQAPEPKDQTFKYERKDHSVIPNHERHSIENDPKQFSIENRATTSSEEESKPSLSDNGHKNDYKNSAVPIRDVDLGDFSYERIQVNENGKVVPTKDTHEYDDLNAAVEIIASTTLKPPFISLPVESIPALNDNKFNDKLVHINDGEVKPVVEISTEDDNSSSEERSNTSNEDTSLESVLGVDIIKNHDEPSDKITVEANQKKEDIKQQFERIPLDYKHDSKDLDNSTHSNESPKLDDTTVTENYGTLDAFAPKDVPLDDKLNIKFDNIAFTLPEIKLPDDILSYSKPSFPYNEKNERISKENNYPYYGHKERAHKSENNDDDDNRPYYKSSETVRKDKNNEDEDDEGNEDDRPYYKSNENIRKITSNDESDDDHIKTYYNYHGNHPSKESYKKKRVEDETDEEEDLYEKFVRERFGKRGTFEKRNEKLQAVPGNPNLYQALQKILKQTANIDEQAKTSGDPNAGYMWTLEYGENL